MLQPSIVASEAQQGWVTAIAKDEPPFLNLQKNPCMQELQWYDAE